MEAILRFIEQLKLWLELKKETELYLMEPIFDTTYCWNESEEIFNMEKSRTIYFDKSAGKELIASIYNNQSIDCWKLYIIDGRKISKVFIEERMLKPVSKKE